MIKVRWFCSEDEDCTHNNTVEYVDVNDLISDMQTAGFPICEDCTADLDWEVIEEPVSIKDALSEIEILAHDKNISNADKSVIVVHLYKIWKLASDALK